MMGFIERHREIVRAADLPVRDRLAGGEVGDLDLLLVRDIDEDAGPHLLELEGFRMRRSEEHTSELQSPCNLVCRLLLEKKKKKRIQVNAQLSILDLSDDVW